MAERQHHHRLRGLLRRRVLRHERLELPAPPLLHVGDLRLLGRGHAGGVLGPRGAEVGVRGRTRLRRVLVDDAGPLFEPGHRRRAVADVRVGGQGVRFDDLLEPRLLVVALRKCDNLLQDPGLLEAVAPGVGRVGRRLDGLQLRQQRLGLGRDHGDVRAAVRRRVLHGTRRRPVEQPPRLADLHHLADGEHVRLAVALLEEHERGALLDEVALAAEGVRRDRVRQAQLDVDPTGLVGECECRRRGREALAGRRRALQQLLGLGRRQPQRLQLLGGGQQGFEPLGVAGLQCREHFLAQLLGRQHIPGVDGAVLVGVRAPLGAVHTKPAELVGLAVGVGVNLAVRLDAVVVEVDEVGRAAALAVDELPQDAALGVLDDGPRRRLRVGHRLDAAARQLRGGRRGDGDGVGRLAGEQVFEPRGLRQPGGVDAGDEGEGR